MREIKFRGKRIDNGEWIYGSLVQATQHCAIVVYETRAVEDGIEHYPIFHEVDTETVGQYTGLNDINGVEIYEGDLLDNDVVAYENGFWKVHLKNHTHIYDMLHDCCEFETVIGNIHT